MPYGNPFQGRFDTGPSDFDRTHRFVASFVWELPRLAGVHLAIRMLLGGWQWTGIVTHSSGDALTILAGTDQSKTNLGGDRAVFVGPLNQYGGVAPEDQRGGCGTGACVPWLNTSLFALPAVGTFGNVGKGAFRGPGCTSFDTGVSKNFYPLGSNTSFRVQLRGEFFNALSHPMFNDPEINRNSGNFGGIRAAADPRIMCPGKRRKRQPPGAHRRRYARRHICRLSIRAGLSRHRSSALLDRSRAWPRSRIELPPDLRKTFPAPAFKYRGFFINDEDLLSGWAPGSQTEKTGISIDVWNKIYETILRLKGNIVAPGTWIFPDEPQIRLAAKPGLIVTQHHAIPLGLNVARWAKDVPYSYSAHRRNSGTSLEARCRRLPARRRSALDPWVARSIGCQLCSL